MCSYCGTVCNDDGEASMQCGGILLFLYSIVPWATRTVVSILIRDAGMQGSVNVYVHMLRWYYTYITGLACTYVGIDHVCAPVDY